MSSRALRKLQKQQEKLQHLEIADDDGSQVIETKNSRAPNLFEMLGTAHGDTVEDITPSSESDVAELNDSPSSAHDAKKNKARRKKNKKIKILKDDQSLAPARKTELANNSSQPDEIDLALKSLSTKPRDGSYAYTMHRQKGCYPELCRLLVVDSKQLNALNEMKRLFGNAVLEGDSEGPGSPSPSRRRARSQQHLDLSGALSARNNPVSHGQGLTGLALRKNAFMAGKTDWPKAPSGGLGMEVEERMNDGTIKYHFIHNKLYQNVQQQFQVAVASMEPERLIQMLQFNREIFFMNSVPSLTLVEAYHISTLLQVSELAKQQTEHSVSGDLLERALFSFGRSVHSSFTTALSEGRARLDFRRPENREFWLAAWRYISSLCQRGTWRTAYEWAKLILSLDPEQDPFRIVWVIDKLALRGGESVHFLQLSNCHWYKQKWQRHPNVRISAALAMYKTGQTSESMAELRLAAMDFPWIFARLFSELNIEHSLKSILGTQPRSERESLECEVYVHGSKDIWNTQENIAFLVNALKGANMSELHLRTKTHNAPMTLNEARHVFLSGVPSLIGLIPQKYTSMPINSSDPFTPPDNLTSYAIGLDTTGPTRIFPGFLHDLDGLPNLLRQMHVSEDEVDEEPIASDEETEAQGLRSMMDYLNPLFWARNQGAQGSEGNDTDSPQDLMGILGRFAPGLMPEQTPFPVSRLVDLLHRPRHMAEDDEDNEDDEDDWHIASSRPASPTMPALEELPDIVATNDPHASNDPATRPPLEDISDASQILEPHVDRLGEHHESGRRLNRDSLSAAYQRHGSAQPELGDTSSPRPYDDERNQRWLAGQGLIRLREFIAAHGVVESAWASNGVFAEGRQIVEEYAQNMKLLRQQQKRNFILNYVLPQGSSAQVRDLIWREMQ